MLSGGSVVVPSTSVYGKPFDKRCRDLMAYKYKFGNCRIPNSMPEYKKLAYWCGTVRTAYNNIQSGKKPGNFKLTADRMERLEDIGFDFEWSPAPPKKRHKDVWFFRPPNLDLFENWNGPVT